MQRLGISLVLAVVFLIPLPFVSVYFSCPIFIIFRDKGLSVMSLGCCGPKRLLYTLLAFLLTLCGYLPGFIFALYLLIKMCTVGNKISSTVARTSSKAAASV